MTVHLSESSVALHRGDAQNRLQQKRFQITPKLEAIASIERPQVNRSLEDYIATHTAVRQQLLPIYQSESGQMFNQIISLYIAADVGLDAIQVTSHSDQFSQNHIPFDEPNPEPLNYTLNHFSSALNRSQEDTLEELTASFFKWVQTDARIAVSRPEFEKYRDHFRELTITIGEKTYSSLAGPQRTHSTSWNGIVGYEDVKQYFQHLADTIQNIHNNYAPPEDLLPMGVLLYGPPGTGKTSTARIFSESAGIPFHAHSVSDIGSSYVFGTSGNVRDIFDEARRDVASGAAASVIYIDEVEALAQSRLSNTSSEDRKAVSAFNNEMQGLTPNERLVVIGATNLPQILDSAINGRFEDQFEMGYPDVGTLVQMYRVKLAERAGRSSYSGFLGDINYTTLGRKSKDFVGREVETVVKRAQRHIWNDYNSRNQPLRPITTQDLLEEVAYVRSKQDNEHQR